MNDNIDNRSPEEIENDIRRTRADFSSTIDAIQHKLTPQQLKNQAVDYALSTTPGVFSTNLVGVVRDNPIPVALIGVGVAWLMAATRQSNQQFHPARQQRVVRRAEVYYPQQVSTSYDTAMDTGMERDYVTSSGMSGTSGTTGSTDSFLNRAGSKASETAQGLKGRASDVSQRLSQTASQLAERVTQVGQSTRSRLQQTTESTRSRLQGATETTRSRLQETMGTAQSQFNDLSERSRTQYYRAKDTMGRYVDEQPLLVGALGLAIGAALGAAAPVTRRENELLGQTRDKLVNRVKETALEQAQTVKESAQRVADMAKQEAARVAQIAKEEAARVAQHAKQEAQTTSQTVAGSVSQQAKDAAASASASVSSQFGGSTPGQQSIH